MTEYRPVTLQFFFDRYTVFMYVVLNYLYPNPSWKNVRGRLRCLVYHWFFFFNMKVLKVELINTFVFYLFKNRYYVHHYYNFENPI